MPLYLSRSTPQARACLALALSLALAGCIGGGAANRSFDSVHQPVIDHASYSLDLNAGPGGLAAGEEHRLADWFGAMDLRYGDKVAIDDPVSSEATRAAVAAALSHYGLLLSHDTPVTASYVNAGTVRVVIVRATASVPGCPDWSDNSETNFRNATSKNFGCAVNSNLAAMIANPDDLLKGAPSTGVSSVARSDKAINAYNATAPSGAGGTLKSESSKSGN